MQFPYKPFGDGREKPLLPIRLSNRYRSLSVRTLGLVDSGSDRCHFDAEFAARLGLKLESGRRERLAGVVPDKTIDTFHFPVDLEVLGRSFEIEVGFVRGLSRHGYGLLGQIGFFDQVAAVIFERRKGVFEVQL